MAIKIHLREVMAMISRDMEGLLKDMAGWFPVVSVTGPRQSGKSTLVRAAFPDYAYVNLEDPQQGRRALEDPVGFIRNAPTPLIIDEAQRAPELFSMIQVVSDERGTTGQFILSGSQNFLLLKGVSQSLAGRVGLLKLLPLSYGELTGADVAPSVDDYMLKGGYPRLYNASIPPSIYYSGYVDTYLERDIAGYLDVRNIASFRTFLALCAQNVGNLLNVSRLASDAGVAHATAKAWLSMLEASYILRLLRPYHANLRKRLTKTPKLYFCDTGLLCHLLHIESREQLPSSEYLGPVFENLVVAEADKRHLNKGKSPELYFYRDDSKVEVDLLDSTDAAHPQAMEIKSSETYHGKYARHLRAVCDELGIAEDGRSVILRVQNSYQTPEANVVAARDWLERR